MLTAWHQKRSDRQRRKMTWRFVRRGTAIVEMMRASKGKLCHFGRFMLVFPCALPNSQPQRCAYISLGHPAVNKGAPESNWPTKYSTSVQFDHFCQTSCFARSIVDTKRQKATISSMVSSLEFIQALAITSRSADNSFREACRRLGIAGALRRLTGP